MNENWQQKALESLLKESLREQRARRRWGIFFKISWLVIILLLLLIYALSGGDESPQQRFSNQAHTAMIKIDGPIMANGVNDADHINASLKAAFESRGTRGIVLRFNTGGGSPVQSDYIYREIERLKKQHPNIKLYAVIRDICASGGYYIASAADEIYADPNSLVGSIGVIAGGFGFVDSMKKLGVERRVFTAGDQKAFLDPFSPLKTKQENEIKTMLNKTHQNFINAVKRGRGSRLKDDKDLFSGRIWTAEQAKKLGLIDAYGDEHYIARNIFKADRVIDYTYQPSFWQSFPRGAGVSMASALLQTLGVNAHFHLSY